VFEETERNAAFLCARVEFGRISARSAAAFWTDVFLSGERVRTGEFFLIGELLRLGEFGERVRTGEFFFGLGI